MSQSIHVWSPRTATKLLPLAALFLLLLTGAPAAASGLNSAFFSSDTTARAILDGTPYDINDPAWLVNVSYQNRDTFAYKLFTALFMLGYQTEIALNGVSGQMPQRLALFAFQSANALPQSNLVSAACLSLLDQRVSAREQALSASAQGFQLYNQMQPLHPNDISRDTLAAIYAIPMRALPKYLRMSAYEELQCINGQCDGFIQDPGGNGMGWPIDPSADFRFVGAYFDPLRANTRLPSAAVHVDTVLHEYAHYLDGFYKVSSNDPLLTKFKVVDTTGFYAIGYDLTSGGNGCFATRSSNPKDWITKYAAQPGYGNCAAGSAVPDEDWAESFSMYVADGRDFRAAAGQSALVALRYQWLKENVFLGLEYDTDLARDTESGCNDVYLYGATGAPGYAHCNNSYVWDFTLKPLAASIVTAPLTPAQGSFFPQGGSEISTVALSNSVTVAGINWPSAISVTGGEYSIDGGTFLSAPGTVNNGDTVTLRLTSSASYSTRSDAVLTIGGVASAFGVTTRTPVQPTISGTPPARALTGSPYLFKPTARDASSFSLSGALPPGVHFDPATGTLSGTPTATGSFGPIVIFAVNGNLATALPGFGIVVAAPIGTFTLTGSLANGRHQPTATALSSGKVLVSGGYDDQYQALASVELYDPATGAWSPAAHMLQAHGDQSATLLPDGSVLVAGGYDESYNELAFAELYDPVADSWSALPPMSSPRAGHTATLLPSGQVLLAGGSAGFNNSSSAELYDPGSKAWQPAAPMSAGRAYGSATLLENGRVLLAGGYDSDWNLTSSAGLYDPASDSWAAAPALLHPRTNFSATLLGDGTVLVAGGYDPGTESGILASAERFDPAAGAWSPAGTLAAQRYWHTATLLHSGMVLVAGGQGAEGYLSSAELYDPVSHSWLAAGPMAASQAYQSASLLSDGRVLLAGGSPDASYEMTVSQLFTAGVTRDYTLSFTTAGSGSLHGVPLQKLAQGASATSLSALPASGYQFLNWSGSGGFLTTTVNPLTVTNVSADQTITANFVAPVSGSCGSSNGAALAFLPATGLCAIGSASSVTGSGPWSWSCLGSSGGTTANCSATKATQTLNLTVSGTGSGTVVSSPAGLAANVSSTVSFGTGTTLALHASAAEFSLCSAWQGDCTVNGVGDCVVTMDTARNVGVVFTKDLAHMTRIGDSSVYYPTLQTAYDNAPAGGTVKARGAPFTENLATGQEKAVTFIGGYNSGYTSNANVTVLNGTLKIKKGTLRVDRLVVRP
jgi:N-acetylneuraminic acid mutarotase